MPSFPDSICLTYLHNFLPVDLEIVSWEPALVIYRNLLTPRQTSDFMNLIEKRDLIAQKTSDYGNQKETTHRRANGSFIEHGEAEITAEVHNKVQKRIPALNFTSAELFSALSYLPGGHYSVHYDYLTYRSEKEHDWWMKNMRNRIGTLIFVLKTAEKGGGTVFPSIGTTIRINPGDAFFWFNTQADESQEMRVNHGGCPIYEGRKVITTLWVRAKNQPILPMASTDSSIHASWLIPSFSSTFRPEMKTECPLQ
ncbi:CRE-PHY-3 protein [Caenorhabditis remanei]|uniref:CRE-PHY-3 protein n=1 Tax=Caenorhabditis remanei TaxID=31234 RepID=E3LJ80_CAERE|nr:CRE-PHY-3 protein [Caenorhabditis remanei]